MVPTPSRLAAIAAAAVVMVAAGCSGGSSSGPGGGSLRSALASVKDRPVSERFFAWADGKELRTLTGVSAPTDVGKAKTKQKWLRLTEVALPSIADKEPQFSAATGINGYGGTRSVTVGVPPEQASRVDGADAGTVIRKFRQVGASEHRVGDRTFLAVAGEGQVDVTNPLLADDVYLAVNRIFINGSSVSWGLSDTPVDTVAGGGRSLADVAAEAAVADCLGDVMVAEVASPAAGAGDGVAMVGIGVRRPATAGAPVTEVMCEAAKSKVQAATLATTLGPRVGPDATLPGSVLHVRDRVAQAGVDQVDKGDQHLARLTLGLVSPARAGFLLFDVQPAGLAFLEGGGGSGPPGP